MAEDRIEFDDLASEEAFKKFIAYGEQIVKTYDKVEASIKGSMSALRGGLSGASPKSIGDVEVLNESIKKTNDYNRALVQITKEKEKIAKETERARLAEIKLAQDREKAFDKFEKQMQKQQSYPAQLRAMQKALIDMTEKGIGPGNKAFDEMAKKAGALKDKISDAKDTIKAFSAESKAAVAKNLFGQVVDDLNNFDVQGASDKAKQFATVIKSMSFKEVTDGLKSFGSAALDVGKALLLNPYAIATAAIAGLAYVTYDAVQAWKNFNTTSKELNESLEESAKRIEDLGKKQAEYLIKLAVAQGKLSKEQGAQKKTELDNYAERGVLIKKFLEDSQTLIKKSEEEKSSIQYKEILRVGKLHAELTRLEKRYRQEMSFLIKTEVTNNQVIQAEADAKAKEEREKQHKKEMEDWQAYQDKLRQLKIDNMNYEYDQRIAQINFNFDKEKREWAGHADILIELEKKKNKELAAVWQERENKNQKILEESRKAEEKRIKDSLAPMTAEDPVLSKKFSKERDDIIKQDDLKKKMRDKEIQDEIKLTKDLLDAYEERYQKIAELQRDQIDAEIDSAESNIEIQAQLAARGLDNTLAYEMNKKSELEKARVQQIEDEKKHAQAMEAAELGLAFIQAYQGYVEKDVPAGQALSRAAADIFAAKIFSKAIAGSFADGVEDFKGKGTGTSDSNIIEFSNGESVVTAKGTAETPGLVTALNEKGYAGAVDWFYKQQFDSGIQLSDVSKKQQVGMAHTAILAKKIEELTDVVKNKTEYHYNLDQLNNVIRKEVVNGISKTTIKKPRLLW